jgi:hypothetical protein
MSIAQSGSLVLPRSTESARLVAERELAELDEEHAAHEELGLVADEDEHDATGSGRSSHLRAVLQDRDGLLLRIARGERLDLRRVVLVALGLTALGGLGLGVASGPLQAASAAVKMPLISLLALLITFPAFYVFGVLQGSRIRVEQALRMFAVGFGLRGAIVAGLAPLLLLVASVGSPYAFVLLMGAFVFGVAEIGFLRTTHRGIETLRQERGDEFSPALLYAWSAVYLLVMVQLVWSFRPIIRHPSVEEFVLFGGHGNLLGYFLQETFGILGG